MDQARHELREKYLTPVCGADGSNILPFTSIGILCRYLGGRLPEASTLSSYMRSFDKT
jgi:hypothetical protein